MELGVDSFVATGLDPEGAGRAGDAGRVRELLEQAALADEVGLDVFGVGEHHRPDYLSSSPAVLLAAIAARTRRIRLTSAVTVLSSDDPVRVFQQFATLDLISKGRIDLTKLTSKIKELKVQLPDQSAITLQTEDTVRYEDLVRVIDECIGAGLPNVSVSAAMG